MNIDSTNITVELRLVEAIQISPLCKDGEGRFVRVLRITYGGGKILEHVLLEENPDALEVVEVPELVKTYDWVEG